ncbi:hypothetical protein CC80DRAFT_559367 [Byssothecium circinans]|uniref:Uncharacterized protein n=1 Tax=Byssothecium circinans TaxID=147558 RepID=A0A6A5U1B8_9PLEO|nr:hypothetical protein CC80DRAFT_559367 [Byssothecium circinans]
MSATSRRANMSTPAKTPSRRVLGDIAQKALNTPSKQAGTALNPPAGTRQQSPLKQVSTLSPHVFEDKENAAMDGAHPKGKKRTIYEVDDVETVHGAKAMFGAREHGKSAWKQGLTAAGLERHMESNPVDLPPPGSPTERNTPTPEPEEAEQAPKLFSQESTSFSNWLNYDQCASQSQKSEHPPPSSSTSPSPPPAPIEEKKSRADLLRTRLGFANYKVKTNQAAKCSSDIISTWESSSPEAPASTSPSNPSMMTTNIPSSTSSTAHRVPSITLSHPHTTSTSTSTSTFKSIKANLDPGRPIGKLSITPATTLAPTPYSSRNTQDRISYDDDFGRDEPLEERIQRMRDDERLQADLTSSAVKGNAAKGLMDLMQGRR